MNQENIRNFCIIAHIDHGKSTLADRFLELTKTVPEREMKEQVLDQMDLERERGITIKLTPVQMLWRAQINADINTDKRGLLYEELTYKIRGAFFNVYNKLGPGHKETIYQKALEEEFSNLNLNYEKEKSIEVLYNETKIGIYKPDFIIENKIIIELKATPFIGKLEEKQTWHYLKGSNYRLALLVNFGGKKLQIKRLIYDIIRENPRTNPRKSAYVLNLIDTPGHVDFTYEVSRSLAAVEGAILLVDATQGVQAQTLTNLHLAKEQNLTIIPVINKIDLPSAEIDRVSQEIESVLGIKKEEIILVSAKEGKGIKEVLEAVCERIPPPKGNCDTPLQSLIFDSVFDSYRGVVAFVRIVNGTIKKGEKIRFLATNKEGEALEVGHFKPKPSPTQSLSCGEIGYIVTGLKSVRDAKVGDTITVQSSIRQPPDKAQSLPGYKQVKPFVFASFFTTSGEPKELREALEKLKLNDAALSFEPEKSSVLGLGFRCGFLGLLHLDIVRERLEREYNLDLIITTPSVPYKIAISDSSTSLSSSLSDLGVEGRASRGSAISKIVINNPSELPDPSQTKEIAEPYVKLEIISPANYLGSIMKLTQNRRGAYKEMKYLDPKTVLLTYEIPLVEILVDFYDQLKQVSSGYASLNYELIGFRPEKLIKDGLFGSW